MPSHANYQGVVITAPVSLPYTRYSEHDAPWFIGSVLRSLENPITTKRIDEGLALAMPWYIGQK